MPKKRKLKKHRSKASRARATKTHRGKSVRSSASKPKQRKQPHKAKKARKSRKPNKRTNKKRSAAAKKGWAKRRKKQALVKAMADHRWRQIEVDYPDEPTREDHLELLESLDIDLPTRDELYDYLSWLAEEFDIELSDLYRMYFGYGLAAE